MATAKTTKAAPLRFPNQPVAQALQSTLKDTYALYLLTHNYHWNVEGANFFGLHTLFEQQYNELFAAVDVLAERIRALDAYALPNHYEDVLEQLRQYPDPLSREKDKNNAARKMIENLLAANQQAVDSAQATKKISEKAEDDGTADLMIERIQVHQKAIWMLRSLLK